MQLTVASASMPSKNSICAQAQPSPLAEHPPPSLRASRQNGSTRILVTNCCQTLLVTEFQTKVQRHIGMRRWHTCSSVNATTLESHRFLGAIAGATLFLRNEVLPGPAKQQRQAHDECITAARDAALRRYL